MLRHSDMGSASYVRLARSGADGGYLSERQRVGEGWLWRQMLSARSGSAASDVWPPRVTGRCATREAAGTIRHRGRCQQGGLKIQQYRCRSKVRSHSRSRSAASTRMASRVGFSSRAAEGLEGGCGDVNRRGRIRMQDLAQRFEGSFDTSPSPAWSCQQSG